MNKNKINFKHLIVFFILIGFLMPSLCNAGNNKHINNGKVIFIGNFPIDQNTKDNERKDTVIAKVVNNGKIIGTIETRDNNLKLAYCAQGKRDKIIWQYGDYYYVNKITYDATGNLIRIYYNGVLLRECWYVNEFYIDTYRLKKRLLKRGKWRLF